MKLKQRLTALLLSAGMLLTPAASLAEETGYTIPSGEVTTTALSDAYVGGEQINVSASFELNALLDSETLAGMLDTDAETAEKSSPRSPGSSRSARSSCPSMTTSAPRASMGSCCWAARRC